MSTPESPLQKFQALLGEMLQAEKSDLDFGIYRVIGHRRGDMEDFIIKTIPAAVDQAVADAQPYNAAVKEKEELERQIRRDVGNNAFTPDGELRPDFAEGEAGKKWHEVCARASGAQLLTAPDVYNRLLQFFGRYYHEGDFVSKRRYAGNAKYAVPYDGREVLLHWANRDQYYVKTADRFAQYTLTADKSAFQFRVEKTAAQKDNNKPPKGVFVLADARDENGRVIAVFHRRELSEEDKEGIKPFAKNGGDQQAKIIALAEKQIKDGKFPLLRSLCDSHSTQKEKTRFAVHAARFVRRNTSDYFIHRNLRAFLRRELDVFLKNETINADELAENALAQNRIAAFRAVRNVARQVIDMLAQWEDFQKALWEKKKFILQTEYCAALGHIPKWKNCGILKDIAECKEQWEEWEKLGMCGESPDLFSANGKGKREKRIAFLRENPSLPVDTAYFPPEFKDRLLDYFRGEDDIPGIDDATDGVLIHGDNWQALNLIQEMYRGRIKSVYIDPPYNTDASAILYKNDYKHSSWLSMMDGRLQLTPAFMTADGILCAAIDDEEQPFLRILLSSIFAKELGIVPVRSNPVGRKTSGRFAPSHEYALFWGVSETAIPGSLPKNEKALSRFPLQDKDGKFAWLNLIRTGTGDKKEDSPTMYYPIYVGTDDRIRIPKMEWDKGKNEWRILEQPNKGEIAVWPVEKNDEGNIDKRWQRGCERVASELDEYRVRRAANGDINIDFKTRMDEESMPNTWWGDSKYAAAVQGTTLVKKLLGDNKFHFPKSLRLVEDCLRASGLGATDFALDYFAGSGTTAHAVMNLNREDGGRRKFILAEMGEHFNTAILPRVKKVIYSPEWRAGKATRPATAEERERGPRLVKYHRIESYEDALDNLDFDADRAMRKLGDFIPRYMLRWESRNSPTFLSDEKLENPFDYKLQLSGESARTERADLPETFAYLIGLRIQTRRVLTDEAGQNKSRYVVCRGECGDAEATAIWRDVSGWEEADYERDRKFVEENGLAAGRVWMNGNSLVPGASVLDVEFRERMFPPLVREDAE